MKTFEVTITIVVILQVVFKQNKNIIKSDEGGFWCGSGGESIFVCGLMQMYDHTRKQPDRELLFRERARCDPRTGATHCMFGDLQRLRNALILVFPMDKQDWDIICHGTLLIQILAVRLLSLQTSSIKVNMMLSFVAHSLKTWLIFVALV
jgi:hypothetical protein